jgi:hypothetical protein
MSKHTRATGKNPGHVVLFNPSEEGSTHMAQKKRRKKASTGGKKRRKSSRRRARSTAVATVRRAPRRMRRRARAGSVMKVRRVRRRRSNPSAMSWTSMGVHALGGSLALGTEFGLSKIPQLTGYGFLAADAVAPMILGVVAAYAKMPGIAGGLFGAAGYKTAQNALAAYHLMQASKAAPAAPSSGQKGFGSVRTLPQARAVAQGFGSVRQNVRGR